MKRSQPAKSLQVAKRLMLEDLARSGLTARDAAELGFQPLPPATTEALVGVPAMGYRLPYYDVQGHEDPEVFRVRLFDRTPKYRQPAGTPPRAWLCPLMDWPAAFADPAQPLLITEGEKKAAAGCKAGYLTIGLGGVWSWRHAMAGEALLPELADVDWRERDVYLVFDSDLKTNPQVALALATLAGELMRRGALVHVADLDLGGAAKVGLDDFLVTHGAEALDDRLDAAESFQLSQALWQLNEELAQIGSRLLPLADNPDRTLYTPTEVAGAILSHRKIAIMKNGRLIETNAVRHWLEWPHRRRHLGLTYRPGEPEVTADNYLNLWSGWGIEPDPAVDATPFVELVDFLLSESPPAAHQWFLQWLACPLQRPGTKLFSAVLLFSRLQGTGKSLLGLTMGRIYGDNFSEIGHAELYSKYTGWAKGKQFVLGEEISGSDRRKDSDRLKHIITQERITIDIKYQPTYMIPNLMNFLLCSNHPDALYLEDSDRRHLVVRTPERHQPAEFYRAYDRWLRQENGAAGVFHYLMNEVDCADFNPYGPPPLTDAKRDMVSTSRSSLDAWCTQLLESPHETLRFGDVHLLRDVGGELYTPAELLEIYNQQHGRHGGGATLNAMGRALRRAGCFPNPNQVRTSRGALTLFPVVNQDRWHARQPAAWREHYDKKNLGDWLVANRVELINARTRRKLRLRRGEGGSDSEQSKP